MGLLKGAPPFDLVQLSTIPKELWKGRAVFHPGCQVGNTPYWRPCDDPYADEEEKEDTNPCYDVGVVLTWKYDGVISMIERVQFVGNCGSTLIYGANNLWTPKLMPNDMELLALLGKTINEEEVHP